MLKNGIINPGILHLLSRIRHTNTLVIADARFPFWPQIETVDVSIVEGLPTVLQVLDAIRQNFTIGRAWAAREFLRANDPAAQAELRRRFDGVPLDFEPHAEFKQRVPRAIGLIRTGCPVPYSNLIVESA